MNDYLWDPSGEPDDEIQRLERALARFRTDPPAPAWLRQATWFGRPVRLIAAPLAAAAMLALVVAPGWFLLKSRSFGWDVATLAGQPTVDAQPVSTSARLDVGEWLETDGVSEARLAVGRIGQVVVSPNSRVRLLEARGTDHRLRLQRGKITASIWAPPRVFAVETPSALAVDLGCIYSVAVDDDGVGTLKVASGWVSFEVAGRESFVPAGAVCITRPATGPGTPFYEEAPAALVDALAVLDTSTDAATREAAVDTVLAYARKRDAFTIWHLLGQTDGAVLLRVYDRLAGFVPPPTSVTRDGLLSHDRAMLDAWWNALGLDDAAWFRVWKGPVPQSSGTRWTPKKGPAPVR